MNEQFKENSPLPPQAEPDVIALLKKIQSHLIILEKKIDSLSKPQERPPFREKHFSKPFRPFSHSRPHDKREHDRPREGGFERFKKHKRDEGQGFGQKKKPFFHKQKDQR